MRLVTGLALTLGAALIPSTAGAVPAAHVAEQSAIASWFLDHHQGTPVVLLIVLDDAWCSPDPSLRGRPWCSAATPVATTEIYANGQAGAAHHDDAQPLGRAS